MLDGISKKFIFFVMKKIRQKLWKQKWSRCSVLL